jgi:hypothetical protein
MTVMTRILIVTAICWLFTSPAMALPARNFTIVTEPSLGFKEGETVYKLGRPMSTFLASFGPAEKIEKDQYDEWHSKLFTEAEYAKQYLAYTTTYYYVNDGVMITEDKQGAIKGIIFYVVASESLKPANVKTDKGITSGASLAEILKAYGEPFKRTKADLLGYEDLQIYYKYNNDVLTFRFKNGSLQTISLNAKYLPYLAEME